MKRGARNIIHNLLLLGILIVLLVGTLWPTGLDLLLPEKWHYATWPLALKVAGWCAVLVLFLWDASDRARSRGDVSETRS